MFPVCEPAFLELPGSEIKVADWVVLPGEKVGVVAALRDSPSHREPLVLIIYKEPRRKLGSKPSKGKRGFRYIYEEWQRLSLVQSHCPASMEELLTHPNDHIRIYFSDLYRNDWKLIKRKEVGDKNANRKWKVRIRS